MPKEYDHLRVMWGGGEIMPFDRIVIPLLLFLLVSFKTKSTTAFRSAFLCKNYVFLPSVLFPHGDQNVL